jgi:hypothetical protein
MAEKGWSVTTHVKVVRGKVLQEILLRYAARVVHAVDGIVDFK